MGRLLLMPLVFCGLLFPAGPARSELLRVEFDLFASFRLVEEPANIDSAFINIGSGQGTATFLFEVDESSQVLIDNAITLEQLDVSNVPINFEFMGDTYAGQFGLSLDAPIETRLNFFGNFNLFSFEQTMSGSLQCTGTCSADASFPPSTSVSFDMPVTGQIAEGSLQQGTTFRPGLGAYLAAGMPPEPLTIGGYGILFSGTGFETSRAMVPEPGATVLLLLALPLLARRRTSRRA